MIRSATLSSRGWAAATVLAVAALSLVPPAPASATPGRCTPGKGVTVVVDYGPLGGGVVVACDPNGAGKSAAQVVTAAGFDLDYVSSQPGFVCRVDSKPAEEDCGDTPPPDAYWGLFWSDADPASWTYSSEGVGSLDVPDGGSIGWRFQDGGTRDYPGAPPTEKAKAPSPQPTRTPSPEPDQPSEEADPAPSPTPSASVPPGTGSGKPPSEEADPARPRPKRPGADRGDHGGKGRKDGKGKDRDQGKPRDKAHPEQAAAPAESPAVEAELSPSSGEPMQDDGSSTTLNLVAGGAVLLLAGAAGVIAWRRRA